MDTSPSPDDPPEGSAARDADARSPGSTTDHPAGLAAGPPSDDAPAELLAGLRAVSPLLLGILPFALVAGYAAVEAGFTPAEAVGLSLLVFAGSSQIAAIELVGRGAPAVVVVGTIVVVNLRMLMYSASIAPYLRHLSTRRKAALSYLLTDQAYALTIRRLTRRGDDGAGEGDAGAGGTGDGVGEDVDRPTRSVPRRATHSDLWFYLGAGGGVWAVWQVGTVVGVALGTGVPPEWGLSFAGPLVFLALLVPSIEGRASAAAAVVAGAVAVLGDGLPLNSGLLVAAAVGVLVGVVAEEWGWGA